MPTRSRTFVGPDVDPPSNMKLDKHYDQIGFKSRPGQIEFGGHAGVFNVYDSVFRPDDFEAYLGHMNKLDRLELGDDGKPLPNAHNRKYYTDTWRTFQMSDHLPMWIELKIDFADDYLMDLTRSSFDTGAEHPMSFDLPELKTRP